MLKKIDYIKKNIPKYSLTEGLNEKSFRKIIEKVINNVFFEIDSSNKILWLYKP